MKKLLLFLSLLLLGVEFSAAQNGNALEKGEWRKALDKCFENYTEKDNYGVYKGELEEYSVYKSEGDGTYRTGSGMYKWNDGSIYIGGWSGWQREGVGITIMPEGYVFSYSGNAVFYVGEYYYSRSGLGVYYDRYGNVVYAGDFKDDYPTEKYPMSGFDNYKFECKEYSSGNYFVGMTKEGKPDGLGFYIWSNGNLWFGEWENGERNGYGIHMSYEGKITTGEWKDGKKQ